MISRVRTVGITVTLCIAACTGIPKSTAPLAGTWVVEDIAGRGIIDYSHVELVLEHDGQLSGSTGCNLLIGRYRVEGSAMTINVATTTRKVCPEALMHQERVFLRAIESIDSYRFDPTGALVLQDGNQPWVLAQSHKRRP
ncbi:META domain-containing protein [Tsuneonella flava]|uniref:META domain-containing protein n=1 Tax=Tsuneonella flava TaxID=2055955 RepID=A0ABX7KEP8_9SPHN|nr:META domain-containing protein [Tsuneonella flava]QSB45160.1 META domain-containing protein [Tsuneonella flava]